MTPLHTASRLPPRGLAQIKLTREQRVFFETEALEIFTLMVNAGGTLQQTLAAVFLSGMSAAAESRREK